MNKRIALSVMAGGILLVVVAFAQMASTETRTGSVFPQMGMMRSGQNVTVVNLDPVDVVTYGVALGHVTLKYGERCYMFTGAPFTAVGVDGQRVLVRSRVQGPHQLYDEGAPVCSGDVLFWMNYQQFLLSAEAYRKAQQEALVAQSKDERDKNTIRRLLDEQLARK